MKVNVTPTLRELRDYLNTLAENTLDNPAYFRDGDNVSKVFRAIEIPEPMYYLSDSPEHCYDEAIMRKICPDKSKWIHDHDATLIVLEPIDSHKH